jgi:hypothetical protein
VIEDIMQDLSFIMSQVCQQISQVQQTTALAHGLVKGCCITESVQVNDEAAHFQLPPELQCFDFSATTFALNPFPDALLPDDHILVSRADSLRSQQNGQAVPVFNLTEEVNITFTVPVSSSPYVCSYLWLNTSAQGQVLSSEWRQDGCRLLSVTPLNGSMMVQLVCGCTHLTNFGVLLGASASSGGGGQYTSNSNSSPALTIGITVASVLVAAILVTIIVVVVVAGLVHSQRRKKRRSQNLQAMFVQHDPDNHLNSREYSISSMDNSSRGSVTIRNPFHGSLALEDNAL